MLFMHSGYVEDDHTTAVRVPRNQLPSDNLGTLLVACLPRDHASSDSLNNLDLIKSLNNQIQSLSPHETLDLRDLVSFDLKADSTAELILPRDRVDSMKPVIDSIQSIQTQLNSINSIIDPNLMIKSVFNLTTSLADSLIKIKSKEISTPMEIDSPKSDVLPTHLKSLPPNISIPDGYNWIFVHGGWTLVPTINSGKLFSQDPTPPISPLDHSNDELLD